MKRRIVALLVVGLVAFAVLAETSVYYPIRLDVVKVYSHADGYKVVYRKGALDVAEFYLPITWIVPGGRAEIIRGHDTSYPYAILFYKEGKFDHLKLYVFADQRDPTWGQLSQDEGRGKFDLQEPKIQF